MAKKSGSFGNLRPGRKQGTFKHLVSPLGYNGAEDNDYSPATPVNGSRTGKGGGASQSGYAKNERRGG